MALPFGDLLGPAHVISIGYAANKSFNCQTSVMVSTLSSATLGMAEDEENWQDEV
jgi:hypothetical protein